MSQPFEILYKSMKENMSTSPFSLSLGDEEQEQSCCVPSTSSDGKIYSDTTVECVSQWVYLSQWQRFQEYC